MSQYQYRTIADLDRFQAALTELADHLKENEIFCATAAATVLNNSGNDSAPAFGIAAAQAAIDAFEAAIKKFEVAAVRLLGEPRQPGEPPLDYFDRIKALPGDSLEFLQAAMQRRGLMLMPW